MKQISKETWGKVNKLSEQEIDKLAYLMGVGFLNHDLEKDEKAFILTG